MHEMTLEEREQAQAACPACRSNDVEWRVITGYVYVGEIEHEQEADVAKCLACGAQWSS